MILNTKSKSENKFSSLSLIKSSKSLFAICLLLNIFFLVAITYIIATFYPKIIDELIAISEIIGTGELARTTLSQLTAPQSNQPLFHESYNNMIRYFFLMVLSLYFSYSVLQGIAWKIAIKRIMKKLTLTTYLRRFFAINVVWLILILLIFAAYIQITFTNAAILSNSAPPIIFNLFFIIIIAVLFYFIIISYTLAYKYGFIRNLKNVLKTGTNSFGKTCKPVLALYFIFFIDYFIFNFFYNEFKIIEITLLFSILIIEIIRWEFVTKTLHQNPSS